GSSRLPPPGGVSPPGEGGRGARATAPPCCDQDTGDSRAWVPASGQVRRWSHPCARGFPAGGCAHRADEFRARVADDDETAAGGLRERFVRIRARSLSVDPRGVSHLSWNVGRRREARCCNESSLPSWW